MLVTVSLLLILASVIPASAKLAGAPVVRESAAHFRHPVGPVPADQRV